MERYSNYRNENSGKDTKIKVDYLYGDLSNVDTKILRAGLSSYKNFSSFHDGRENEDHAAEAIIRIEGELLKRKEILLEDISKEEKVLEESEI